MNINEIYDEIVNFFKNNADERIVKKYSRYFKDGYDAYGVDPLIFEKWFKDNCTKYISALNIAEINKLCTILFKSGKYEEGGYAIWIIKACPKCYSKEQIQIIRDWFDSYIGNWAHTDIFSIEILSIFVQREIINLNDLSEWRNSPSKWTRRAIPVSFIKILNLYRVDDLLKFIHPIINDKEKPVQQGLGWFLREAWKKKPKEIEKYLLHIKDTAPRVIIQYATEKMSKEEKEKYKRVKTPR